MVSAEENTEKLQGMDHNELMTRHFLGRAIIKLLRTEWADEEEAEEALDRYQAQQDQINAEIRRRRRKQREDAGIPKPAPRRVKAKAARLGRKK